MSTQEMHSVAAAVSEGVGLSQIERVTDIFSAPSKTFEDVKRGNKSWWLPFLLFVVIGTGLWQAVTMEVGWRAVTENGLRVSPKNAERLDALPPDQKAQQMKYSELGQKWFWLFAPVGVLVMNLIGAAVLLATINFGFGGKATFGSVLAVIWYGGIPGLIKLILGAASLFAGVAPESFLPGNPAGTNIGYYLNPVETNRVLYSLAVSIDPITIWSLVLTAIGLSIVAGTKRNAGYMAVFGWWGLMLVLGAGFSAMFS